MIRGDIVYVRNYAHKSTGSEWSKDRPAVIVSNDRCNESSPVVEVVFTTGAKRKYLLPTHVILKSSLYPCVALCEHVYSVDKSRIDRIIGHCTQDELTRINKALTISLDLNGGDVNETIPTSD